jgi:hypothetical protein
MDIVENISATVNSSLEGIYSNKTTSAVIGLFLVLYAGLAAPKLPKSVAKLFGNSAFRLVILFLVAYMSSRNTSIAIIATVALVISMQTLSYHEANEKVHQKIEEEVLMETADELEGEGEEEELDTEEAERLMEEEQEVHEGNFDSQGDFAEFKSEEDVEEEVFNGNFKPEEQPMFRGEEEEIIGKHDEEVYASVGEENGLLMEETHHHGEEYHHREEKHHHGEEEDHHGEEEFLGEEMEVRPEELMAEEVYGDQDANVEELLRQEVPRPEEEVVETQELRAQPEKNGYVFNVTGYSGSEFATY